MADWSASIPDLTTAYTLVLTELQARDIDAYTLAESPTNPPTGAIRYVRASDKFQEWNGSAWVDKIISLAGGGTGATTAAGARASLGLGTMALQNNNAVVITGGTIAGLTTLDAPASATGQWVFTGAAPQIALHNATSNWFEWNTNGIAAPTFTSISVGTKLRLFPAISGSSVDFAIGVEGNGFWQSVGTDNDSFKWYHGTTQNLRLGFDVISGTYGLPTLHLSPAIDKVGARLEINAIASANAPLIVQSGEPGISFNRALFGVNYKGTTTAASARVNTGVGGSFARFNTNGAIEFVSIDASGVLTSQGGFDGSANFTIKDITLRTSAAAGELDFIYGGNVKTSFFLSAPYAVFRLVAGAFGSGQQGTDVQIGRNTSGAGAAGAIILDDRNGISYALWVDAAGKLRIGTTRPIEGSGDTGGTIVGTQT